jgi:tripartite-type tricarboxylate transporter receptor subunit TctC
MKRKMLFVLMGLVLCLFLTVGSINSAEKYPSRPVIIVSPFVPGGALSTIAHITGKYLEKSLGVPFVVDNKPGGGTVIGTAYVANAPPDGYTLLCAADVFTSILMGTAPYKMEDLSVVAQISLNGCALSVRSDAPWKSFQEFVDYARKNPGLKFVHPGVGSFIYFRMENMNRQAKLKMIGVPMKGDTEIISALLGGHVPVAVGSTFSHKAQADAGKFRILLSFETAAAFGLDPNIPDVESFFKGSIYDIPVSVYIYAPAKVPKERIEILEKALEKIIKEIEFVEEMKKIGQMISFIPGNKVMREILPKKIETVREIMRETGMVK